VLRCSAHNGQIWVTAVGPVSQSMSLQHMHTSPVRTGPGVGVAKPACRRRKQRQHPMGPASLQTIHAAALYACLTRENTREAWAGQSLHAADSKACTRHDQVSIS
jgi:hypothetical protein